MKNKFISALLAGCLVVGCIGPVSAEDIVINDRDVVDGSATTPVKLTTETLAFSVTVPTSLPVHVDDRGAVSIANNAAIVNNSAGPVKVENVKVEADENWTLAEYGDLSGEKVGTKKFGFAINNVGASATDGSCDAEFNVVPAKKSEIFTYNAYIAPQVTEVTDTIANVVFTIGWDKSEEAEETTLPFCLTLVEENGQDFTFQMSAKNWDGQLYYSTDASNWTEYTDPATIVNSKNSKLYLQGTNNTTFVTDTNSNNNVSKIILPENSKIKCLGNIETLLDYNTVLLGEHPTMSADCFAYLFAGCSALTTPPELPSLNLTSGCYSFMFTNCSSLKTAPELPAETTASGCYEFMFYNCSSLIEAPELNATGRIENRAYTYMFGNCTSLIKAPSKLPAINVRSSSYQGMFTGCSSLKVPSAFPEGLSLLNSACKWMYADCTSLIALPEIDIAFTQPASGCLIGMFEGCTLINIIGKRDIEKGFTVMYTITSESQITSQFDDMFSGTGALDSFTPSPNRTCYLSTSNSVVPCI